MRLVFLYLQNKRAAYYANRIKEEGYFYLIKRMVDTGIVDSALIIIDSGKNTKFSYSQKVEGVSTAGLGELNKHLRDGDVIWCRGGWRAWHDVLQSWKGKHWLLLYAANTGRERWKFWDVIFEDRQKKMTLDRFGRFWFFFKKPTHPGIFRPMGEEKVWDLCIGASSIHDRKAQWKVIDALVEYRRRYGGDISCVLPGGIRGGQKTMERLEMARKSQLRVYVPGEVDRRQLAKLMNQSKLFIHLGGHGQNDRGPLEAMRCGTPVLIETQRAHAPLVYECPLNAVVPLPNDPVMLAVYLHDQLEMCDEASRAMVFNYHQKVSSVETVILPEMKELFRVIRENPIPNTQAVVDHFGRKNG